MKTTMTTMGKRLAVLVMGVSVCSVVMGAEIPDAWTKMAPGKLGWEARRLKGQLPFSKESLGQLGGYAAQRYSQAKGAEKFDIKQWVLVASELGSYLPAAAKGIMAADIRSGFFGDGGTADGLTLKEYRDAAVALHALGVEDAPQLLADRVSGLLAEGEVGLGEIVTMHKELGDPVSLKARAKLAEHVQARYLTDPETIKSVTLEGWSIIVQEFHATIAEEARPLWVDKLRGVFTTQQALAGMTAAEREAMSQMLMRLGAAERAKEVLAAWMSATDAWKSGDFSQLASMAGQLAGAGEPAKAARRALVGHIQGTYLAEGRSVETIAPELWVQAIKALKQDLTGEERKTWAGRFLGALEQTSPGDKKRRDQLCWILGNLGIQASPDQPISVPDVLAKEAWLAWDTVGLIDLGRRLSALEPDEATAQAWTKLVGHIEQTRLADDKAVRSVSCGQWWDLARHYAKGRTEAAGKDWAGKIRAAYIGNAAVFGRLRADEVIALGKALVLLGDADGQKVVGEWLSRKS